MSYLLKIAAILSSDESPAKWLFVTMFCHESMCLT